MKALLVLLDGAADRAQEALGGGTPLQAARTPNLDALTRAGSCALLYPLAPGVRFDPGLSAWTTLGYGAHPYPGAAGIEAAGAGVEMGPGDVAFRVDLAATMVDGGARYVQASPVGMPADDAAALAESLAAFPPGELSGSVHPLEGCSLVLVFSGGASERVTGSDPIFYGNPVAEPRPLDDTDGAAALTARELGRFTEWASGVLAAHPVVQSRRADGMTAPDSMLIKDPSRRPEVPPFREKWGFRCHMAASGPLYRGLAALSGMEFADAGHREAGEDLHRKLLAARGALDGGFDMAVVSSVAAREVSRSGRPSRKVRVLEELDLAMTAAGEAFATDPEVLMVVTCCCTSPSGDADRVLDSGEPVPLLVLGRGARVHATRSFDEVSCSGGCMGTLRGTDVMPLIATMTNRDAR